MVEISDLKNQKASEVAGNCRRLKVPKYKLKKIRPSLSILDVSGCNPKK